MSNYTGAFDPALAYDNAEPENTDAEAVEEEDEGLDADELADREWDDAQDDAMDYDDYVDYGEGY